MCMGSGKVAHGPREMYAWPVWGGLWDARIICGVPMCNEGLVGNKDVGVCS